MCKQTVCDLDAAATVVRRRPAGGDATWPPAGWYRSPIPGMKDCLLRLQSHSSPSYLLWAGSVSRTSNNTREQTFAGSCPPVSATWMATKEATCSTQAHQVRLNRLAHVTKVLLWARACRCCCPPQRCWGCKPWPARAQRTTSRSTRLARRVTDSANVHWLLPAVPAGCRPCHGMPLGCCCHCCCRPNVYTCQLLTRCSSRQGSTCWAP